MSVDLGSYLSMVEGFLSYLEDLAKGLPEEDRRWIEDYHSKLSKLYEEAKETGDPRVIGECLSIIREIVDKLVYGGLDSEAPPLDLASRILGNLGYNVRWVNSSGLNLPFDLLAVRGGGVYLVKVLFSESGDSSGFQNTWPSDIRFFCDRLGAEPLVMLLCRGGGGFDALFMAPLINDVTFHEGRTVDIAVLEDKFNAFLKSLEAGSMVKPQQ
ncbi:MAG: hypothetical protein LM601_09745 [Candidatus Verstraetearchaeota archaeon]|jgi:hypothetical protein|nr:hypothetical protein [Candidatus Verstraetearchaeota archaeon]